MIPPLVVDLDGTLLKVDTLYERFVSGRFNKPDQTLLSLFTLRKGIAAFKHRLARIVPLDIQSLPVREELLVYLRREAAAGREVHLATAADRTVAASVAEDFRSFKQYKAQVKTSISKGLTKQNASPSFSLTGLYMPGTVARIFRFGKARAQRWSCREAPHCTPQFAPLESSSNTFSISGRGGWMRGNVGAIHLVRSAFRGCITLSFRFCLQSAFGSEFCRKLAPSALLLTFSMFLLIISFGSRNERAKACQKQLGILMLNYCRSNRGRDLELAKSLKIDHLKTNM
ncbi:MAG: hypothetical protein QOJ84_4332 [Bradyrhizobium sp.]|jgi:hypothetical protein|nr:hypothetical protein [Bradyrhizobium sp.]